MSSDSLSKRNWVARVECLMCDHPARPHAPLPPHTHTVADSGKGLHLTLALERCSRRVVKEGFDVLMWLWWLLGSVLADLKIKVVFVGPMPPTDMVAVTIASVVGPPVHAGMVDVCVHRQTVLALVRVTDAQDSVHKRFKDTLSAPALSDALDATVTDLHLSQCAGACVCKPSGL